MDSLVGLIVNLIKLIFSSIFSFIITYLIILFSIKLFGIWKIKKNEGALKSICPKCGNQSSRVSKNNYDKARKIFSLNLLDWKRHTCYSCYWEGSRWD